MDATTDVTVERTDVYIPSREGIILTGAGTEYPRGNVQTHVLLAHDITNMIVDDTKALQGLMIDEKLAIWEKIDLYRRSALGLYGARNTGVRGGLDIQTMDQRRRVTVTIANYRTVTGAVVAAQSLVNEVLDALTDGIDPGIRAIVNNAFVRDPTSGHVSLDKLISLKTIKIDHPLWPNAIQAIEDSVATISSKLQIRTYERESHLHEWKLIALQFSAL